MKHLRLALLPLLVSLVWAQQNHSRVLAQLKIEGPSYFRLAFDGEVVYAKKIDVVIDAKGRLADVRGGYLTPAINVPENDAQLSVSTDGWVRVGDSKIGRLVVAKFSSDSVAQLKGDYYVSARRPVSVDPGTKEEGQILTISAYGDRAASTPPKDTVAKAPIVKAPIAKAKPAPIAGEFPKKVEGYVATRPAKRGFPEVPQIVVKKFSEVDGEEFTLSDIADITADPMIGQELARVRLGNTPVIGVDRKLDLPYLRAMLKAAGHDPAKLNIEMPNSAQVSRLGQTVTSQDLMNTAIASAEIKFGKNGTLKCASTPPSLKVPKGRLELSCIQVIQSMDGVQAIVEITVSGKKYNTTTVQLVREGGVPKLIVGTQVRVIAVSGTLTVETTGRVTRILNNGLEVEVKTTEGTIMTGRVTADGSVEVKD